MLVEKLRLLFICAGNAQRSPTFEIWFKKNRTQYDVRSTGTYCGYPYRMSEELLTWADRIYVMDLEQKIFIARKYPEFLSKVSVVGCSDQYSRESTELYHLIEYWVGWEGL